MILNLSICFAVVSASSFSTRSSRAFFAFGRFDLSAILMSSLGHIFSCSYIKSANVAACLICASGLVIASFASISCSRSFANWFGAASALKQSTIALTELLKKVKILFPSCPDIMFYS